MSDPLAPVALVPGDAKPVVIPLLNLPALPAEKGPQYKTRGPVINSAHSDYTSSSCESPSTPEAHTTNELRIEERTTKPRSKTLGPSSGFFRKGKESEDGQPEVTVTRCQQPACTVNFNLFNRRHKCRHCGRTFCQRHSTQQLPLVKGTFEFVFDRESLPSDSIQVHRVCDSCFRVHSEVSQRRARGESTGEPAAPTPAPLKPPEQEGPLSLLSAYQNLSSLLLADCAEHTGAAVQMQGKADRALRGLQVALEECLSSMPSNGFSLPTTPKGYETISLPPERANRWADNDTVDVSVTELCARILTSFRFSEDLADSLRERLKGGKGVKADTMPGGGMARVILYLEGQGSDPETTQGELEGSITDLRKLATASTIEEGARKHLGECIKGATECLDWLQLTRHIASQSQRLRMLLSPEAQARLSRAAAGLT